MTTLVSISMVTVALVVSGCGASKAQAHRAESSSDVSKTPSTRAPATDDHASKGFISIATDVRAACGLPEVDAFFSYDSANVRPDDKRILRMLADCFMSGPLAGRQMALTGHADPRGSVEYNLALGGRRADNVRSIIVAEAMSSSRVSTTSRGAMDAVGTTESSWSKDRYVDVNLGP